MPSISRNMLSKWSSYHLTSEGRYVPQRITDPGFSRVMSYPDGSIRETATIFCADAASLPGPAAFSATGERLKTFLADVIDPPQRMFKMDPAQDCIPIGRGWSFAKLIGARDMQIDLTGLSNIAGFEAADLALSSPFDPGRVVLVGGGTRLRELTNWAQRRNLSIMTSGTHLGPTIAGGFGTASHGSRLGFGGLQNMIRGIHLITGPTSSVWIERRSQPLFNSTATDMFSDRTIYDDAVFEDALIHLGAMGIVNGVAVELVDDDGFSLFVTEGNVGATWLDQVAAGAFATIADALGKPGDAPVFYEVTIDPVQWHTTPAIHTMYFPAISLLPDTDIPPAEFRFADLLAGYVTALQEYQQSQEPAASSGEQGLAGMEVSAGLPSAFKLYRDALFAQDIVKHPPQHAKWNQLHGDEITGGYPGALYNASFAVNRHSIPEIVPLICEATKGLPSTFLFTIRFVSNAAGTLAFTRFPETAVIEIDGISRRAPLVGPMLGGAIETGARRIRECLDGENAAGKKFEYSMHWAKLGDLDAAKVERDFGPSGDPDSPLGRWRATRESLLDPALHSLFRSEALTTYGLV